MDAVAKVLNNRLFAILVPAGIGFGMALLSIRGFALYGGSLFLGLPIFVCFLSAFCTSYRREVPLSSAFGVSVFALVCLGGFILIVALDGLICLIMAFPLAMLLGYVGAVLGHWLGTISRSGPATFVPMFTVLAFPGVFAIELHQQSAEVVRCVTTRVVVASTLDEVWRTVVAFPKISEPATGVFRFGIAYPIEARIEGVGVGAIRHCVFSTGAFVEPITRWDEPTLLAFDVTSSPPPMTEMSFYDHVDAPHLHNHMTSHRGQFRLYERDGAVVLEGTTWYSHRLSPQWYWGRISDYVIHRIHERVLDHIRKTCEARSNDDA